MKKILTFISLIAAFGCFSQLFSGNISDQKIGIGGAFEPIELGDFASDPDAVFWEALFVVPETTAARPEWSVVPSNFAFEMNITARINSKGVTTSGANDLLAVVDAAGEIRGVASAIEVGDEWLYFMTAFSNSNTETLYYRFFDQSIEQVLNANQTLSFVSNGVAGQPDDPVVLEMEIISQSIDGTVLSLTLVDTSFLGTERLAITARLLSDPTQFETDTIKLTVVDDFTPLLNSIADQVVNFEEPFDSFDLDDFAVLSDADPVQYVASGQADLTISIDAENVVTIAKPQDWFGEEIITFTIIDVSSNAFSSSQEVSFTGKPQDQAPSITSIPAQTNGTGGTFETIDLNAFVTSQNPDAIRWSYSFVTDSVSAIPDWQVNQSDFQFDMSLTTSVTALGITLSGADHLLSAYSQSDSTLVGVASPIEVGDDWFFFMTINNNNDEDSVFFRVYDSGSERVLPVFETLNFVSNEVLGDPIDPFNLTAGYITIEINAENEAVFETYPSSWLGSELVRFTATDTATSQQLSDSDTVTFQILNITPPRLTDIPDQAIFEGDSFNAIDLSLYLEDLTTDQVTWFIEGADTLSPVLTGNTIRISTPSENYFGSETLTVRVVSNENGDLSDFEQIFFTVQNVNDVPLITSDAILSTSVGELYSYEISVTDIDDEEVEFAISGVPDWLFFVEGATSATLLGIPEEGDVGSYNISISVSDGDALVTQDFVISVSIEFARLLPIENQLIEEGSIFQSLDLGSFLDIEGSLAVTWEVAGGGQNLVPSISADSMLSVAINDENWFGSETLTLSLINVANSEVLDVATIRYEVQNVNDEPVFVSSPVLSTFASSAYESILNVEDLDGDELTFTVSTLPGWLSALSEGSSLILFGTPTAANVGLDEVSVSASDGTVSIPFEFTIEVLELEVPTASITEIGAQNIKEGEAFTDIFLGDFLAVVGNVSVYWEIAGGGQNLVPSISVDSMLSVIITDENWFGSETLTLSLVNAITSEVLDVSTIRYEVQNVNDDPVFVSSPVLSTFASSAYESILNVEDLDGDELTFTVSTMPGWLSDLSEGSSLILFGTPTTADIGLHDVSVSVSDGTVSIPFEFTIEVLEVEVPTASITEIVAQSTTEGEAFTDIFLGDFLEVVGDISVFWEVAGGGQNLVPSISVDSVLSVTISDENWFGSETLTLTLIDVNTSEVIDAVNIHYEVQNVNDDPVFVSSPVLSTFASNAYESILNVEDLDGDELTFTISTIPDWLSDLSEGGSLILFGTPTTADIGLHDVSVSVSDGTASIPFEFTVEVLEVEVPTASILEIAVQGTNEGAAFADLFLGDFLDIQGNISVYWEVSGGGENLVPSISPDSMLSVTITDENWFGTEILKLSLFDSVTLELLDEQAIVYEVRNVNDDPTFRSEPPLASFAGEAYEALILVEDLDGDDLDFEVSKLPTWLSTIENANSIVFFGVPSNEDAGDNQVEFQVSDGKVSISNDFVIDVSPVLGFEDNLEFQVYPNPTSQIIYFNGPDIRYVSLLQLDGKAILEKDLTFSPFLDIGAVSAGTYLLKAHDKKGIQYTTLIKKQ